ncbi:F-box domain containing protein [Tanacetum coccineum]
MDVLPSNIVFNIFSRLPVKCLARSRCISKVWCSYIDDCYLTIIRDKRLAEEPTPLLYHQHLSRDRITTRNLCFHVIELIQTGSTHDYVLKVKEGPFEFMRMKPHWNSSLVSIQVQGSCNGLICLSQDDGNVITSLVVIHRLRKECYELPPFPLRFEKHMHRESCGLGFDTFSNSWKMVCVLLKEYTLPYKPDMVKKNLCTMVHVFGTNSWREIPQVPSYPISGEAVFANGCLHWLASYSDIKTGDGGREVIWFDVNKEEFGVIERPKSMCALWRHSWSDHRLVNLNGEVGYVCTMTMEFLLLNCHTVGLNKRLFLVVLSRMLLGVGIKHRRLSIVCVLCLQPEKWCFTYDQPYWFRDLSRYFYVSEYTVFNPRHQHKFLIHENN